ncbi:MAG: 4-alpha-glucanotransferase [Propionibacteriaceae bacterium]|jgi:4-alpha-glucanotransferase|nr:4-alpha-glucanotransferase [Propionibacteriaceae bacterium]
MADIDSGLAQLAAAHRIAIDFWDWKGQRADVSAATLIAALAALGVDASTPEAVNAALADHELAAWRRTLPPVVVMEQGADKVVDVHVAAGSPAEVWAVCENGVRVDAWQVDNSVPDREVDGHWTGRASFCLPGSLPLGYHSLFLRSGPLLAETTLIVTPAYLDLTDRLSRRPWGFMVQLYSLCSKSGWCFGDLADLADLAVWAKTAHGADYILINPLHAAEPVPPMEPSPYLPCSRRYVNPIYIRPEGVEEYGQLSDRRRRRIASLRRSLNEALADETAIRRDEVWAAKRAALEEIFEADRRPARTMAMEAFFAQGGEALRLWATWCVLSEEYGQNWADWPAELHDPASPEVVSLAQQHAGRVRFHMWLQWVAESQLASAQHKAKEAGMGIGIVADLAVGVKRDGGAEPWMMGDVFAPGVSVGAPPDPYNQAGQTWSQPPFRPDRLEALAYAPYRSMVRAILRHSGGIRVDHIIGLFRLWWIPAGNGPKDGVYVHYDHDAMIGILALEAQRAGAVVVGEDLGTVEPWVRDYLSRRGLLGTSVLWFEYTDDGQVKSPEAWRELCLGSVTTHDLPPTMGYLVHDHVALRHSLGLLTESLADEIAKDVAEQGAIIAMLENRGHLADGDRDPHAILLALHRYLCSTRSRLLCVALTDAVGERRTQNQPGTTDEYPNWRVPLADAEGRRLFLEEIFDLPEVGELARILNGVPGA